MKNLPDEELFDKLKARLQNFEEDPGDDVWTAIETTVRPDSTANSNRFVLILVLMLMGLGRAYLLQSGDSDSSPAVTSPTSSLSPTAGVSPPPNISGAATLNVPGEPSASVRSSELSSSNAPHETSSTVAANQANQSLSQHDRRTSITKSAMPLANNSDTQHSPTTAKNIEPYSDSSHYIAQRPDSIITMVAVVKQDSIIQEEVVVTAKAQKRQSRWRIYGIATPSLTFHHISPSTSDDPIVDKLNSPGVLSSERLSFSFEGGVQFPIAKRLNAFAGLSYYQQSMDLSLEQIMPGSSISVNGSLDFNFQPNTTTTTINYRMQNIGLATGASYVISAGKIMHQLGGALQYEYGMINRSADENYQSSRNFLNFRIFYRAEYGVNERLSVFVQPVFSRSLLSDELMNGAISVKQSRAGFGIGILYRLK
ncbi:MAG: hypothetical protein QM762_01285 [Chryseolinea sp.]